jgi:hypothetical protein
MVVLAYQSQIVKRRLEMAILGLYSEGSSFTGTGQGWANPDLRKFFIGNNRQICRLLSDAS